MNFDHNFSHLMEKIFRENNLEIEHLNVLLEHILNSQLSEIRTAALLTGLRSIPVSPELLISTSEIIKNHAEALIEYPNVINCSAAFGNSFFNVNVNILGVIVAAAAGAKVVQFGARSLFGKTNTVNLLESLEIKLAHNELDVKSDLDDVGISYIYASAFYPDLKHLANVRKSLGFYTLFDIIFPLVNPVQLTGQVLGVFDRKLLQIVGDTLNKLNRKRALVIYNNDHLDDLSIIGCSNIYKIENGKVFEETLNPKHFGINNFSLQELNNQCQSDEWYIFHQVLNCDPKFDAVIQAVCLNSAAILWTAGIGDSLEDSHSIALSTLKSGKALTTLSTWQKHRHLHNEK